MMKSAHLVKRRDAPHRSRLDSPRLRSILRQGEMGSGTVIVTGITRNDPANLPLVKSNHVIQALAAQGPQKPLRRPILPRRARGNRNREQIHARLHEPPPVAVGMGAMRASQSEAAFKRTFSNCMRIRGHNVVG
jgi:hypothetical protein